MLVVPEEPLTWFCMTVATIAMPEGNGGRCHLSRLQTPREVLTDTSPLSALIARPAHAHDVDAFRIWMRP